MKTFQIKEDLATVILNYLASKPYAETYQMIQSLQQLEECDAEVDSPQKTTHN